MVIITLQDNKDLSALQNGIHVTKYYGPKYLRGKLTKINTRGIYYLTRQANVLAILNMGPVMDQQAQPHTLGTRS